MLSAGSAIGGGASQGADSRGLPELPGPQECIACCRPSRSSVPQSTLAVQRVESFDCDTTRSNWSGRFAVQRQPSLVDSTSKPLETTLWPLCASCCWVRPLQPALLYHHCCVTLALHGTGKRDILQPCCLIIGCFPKIASCSCQNKQLLSSSDTANDVCSVS